MSSITCTGSSTVNPARRVPLAIVASIGAASCESAGTSIPALRNPASIGNARSSVSPASSPSDRE